jgi:hypothetical protein
MRNSFTKNILRLVWFEFTVLLSFCSFAVDDSKLHFSPENFLGYRSNNYQHIISAKIFEKLSLSNFTYLDSDFNTKENLYNIRNTISYTLLSNWSTYLAFGLKNPGLYTTASAQYGKNNSTFSYLLRTGATYQKSWTSESITTILYTPKISNNLTAFFKTTFSLNIDRMGITRGIQQFRLGIKNKQLIYGLASNFDQFNYNKKTLTNLGLFLRISY